MTAAGEDGTERISEICGDGYCTFWQEFFFLQERRFCFFLWVKRRLAHSETESG